jgi:hypothetical protein
MTSHNCCRHRFYQAHAICWYNISVLRGRLVRSSRPGLPEQVFLDRHWEHDLTG